LTRKHEHDGGFDHAETVDPYPRLSNADLDRIDAQRRQRRQHRALRAVAVPARAVMLLGAVGVIGWRVTIYDSAHQAAASVRPALACADGNAGLSGLIWNTWTTSGTVGSGQYYENTCTPDCAGGTFVCTPVTVTLSDPLATADGGEYFTMMTVPGEGAWQLGPEGPDGFQSSG